MKAKLFLIFFLILNLSILAQEKPNYQTFKTHKQTIEFGVMLSPMIDLTGTVHDFSFLWGGGAAVIINKNIYVGAFAYSAYKGLNPDGYTKAENYNNYFECAGIWTGYVFNPNILIHPVIDLKAGWGNLAIENLDTELIINFSTYIIKPSFEIEMNISKNLKLGLNIHYQHIGQFNILTETYNMSGTGVGLSFKYGFFE